MGWEQRASGMYYYRKERHGDKIVSCYVGSGETAQLIGQLEELDKDRLSLERAAWEQEKAEFEAADQEIAALFADAVAQFEQAMTAAGYHRPKRGVWRKKRHERCQQ